MSKQNVYVGILLILTGCLLAGCPYQNEGEGDYGPAPAIQLKEWIKGGPVDPLDGQNIYLVEFWSTTCPFCVDVIPHMTALQAAYRDKGVVVVAISVEDADTVRAFVEEQGAAMDYAVAIDDNRITANAYAIHKIPRLFVIDKTGQLIWRGHPLNASLEPLLNALTSGSKADERALNATQENTMFSCCF